MQKTIELALDQAEALDDLSRRRSKPVAEIVQEAIAHRLDIERRRDDLPPGTDPALRDSFGAWEGLLNEDAVDYQRRLRAEWDRDWDR